MVNTALIMLLLPTEYGNGVNTIMVLIRCRYSYYVAIVDVNRSSVMFKTLCEDVFVGFV